MPAFTATAPGKIILFGEHAVVYGQPAIAVPVFEVRARAVVSAGIRLEPGTIRIQAPEIRLEADLARLPSDQPIAAALTGVLQTLAISRPPACVLRIDSTIPIASGLGSGAAVTVAVIRAFSAFLGRPLPLEQVSMLAYEVEKIHHGTPSGIDNTVIAYAMPVTYQRRVHPGGSFDPVLETFPIPEPFEIVIGDTGIRSPTAAAVRSVRAGWQAEPERYNRLFDSVGEIVRSARAAIDAGRVESLGPLMDRNHRLLQEIGVSCPELDRLVEAARAGGALGAKLCGGGLGGNMIALAPPGKSENISSALRYAGAVRTIRTTIQ